MLEQQLGGGREEERDERSSVWTFRCILLLMLHVVFLVLVVVMLVSNFGDVGWRRIVKQGWWGAQRHVSFGSARLQDSASTYMI